MVIIIKYEVEILETLSRTIDVEAATPDEALYIVKERYRKEDIVLESNDFFDVDFIIKSIE
jgi:hypothetical protein